MSESNHGEMNLEEIGAIARQSDEAYRERVQKEIGVIATVENNRASRAATESLSRVAQKLFGRDCLPRDKVLSVSELEDLIVSTAKNRESLAASEWKSKYERLRRISKQFADAYDAHSEARVVECIARNTAEGLGSAKILARMQLERELDGEGTKDAEVDPRE